LMYHGISRRKDIYGQNAEEFEKQIVLLQRHFEIVPAETESTGTRSGPQVALTFDDGFRNHAEVVAPLLRKYRLPATFFVCHRNTQLQKPFWFTYLRMLEHHYPGDHLPFRGEALDFSRESRSASVSALRQILLEAKPHPQGMYEVIEKELPPLNSFIEEDMLADVAHGMTTEQIRELAADPLFTIGAHTMDHPFLPMCDQQEMKRQIEDNKKWLEQLCGQEVRAIAYPNGDYTPEVIAHCKRLGFRRGYVVDRQIGIDSELEAVRSGVYYPSTAELGCKVRLSHATAAWAQVRRLVVAP
jgi:peptidoglycan/xylan/chitin deacetylase (PgdA/CDA1 family)